MDAALLACRLLLAAVLVVAAVGKLGDRPRTASTLARFGLGSGLARAGAWLLPASELAIAILLVPASTARAAALASVAMLLLFSAAISRAMAAEREFDCGCFGRAGGHPADQAALARNGLLGMLAASVALLGPGASI